MYRPCTGETTSVATVNKLLSFLTRDYGQIINLSNSFGLMLPIYLILLTMLFTYTFNNHCRIMCPLFELLLTNAIQLCCI
jgi:hypothetical protein